ncbi:fumarylacetoacetase [Marinibactrum halimedae]|uniref:fumarylacetoacetase n=1 Tax=Marinibactrum halimedae TaxID=1444977 RepID=A0AA37TAS0_9GAMM|nr:fumarylacetoacetase [Marinibactrum halimedae]MCD9457626.1 fumarylacetoacetase [Marinibactrum halimedae]GLS28048.1 fumarylacetoacetase [Marinibactrum halimedae]
MINLNETHDAMLESWLDSANDPNTDFPIQNLPFGVFKRKNTDEAFRVGVAIGDSIIDLTAISWLKDLEENTQKALHSCNSPSLNALMKCGPEVWSSLRLMLSRALRKGSEQEALLRPTLVPQQSVKLKIPVDIGDYTDFYSSIHHATNVGLLFRPENPLLANYSWVPVAYHGRASSIYLSGTDIKRPQGQLKTSFASYPIYAPTEKLDYEVELGVYIGKENRPGETVNIDQTPQHIFGLCVLNDWSARDIQAWEYQPLGPFLSKSFATSISPWVITLEALAPFQMPHERPQSHPSPLSHLNSSQNQALGAIDIQLECYLSSKTMQSDKLNPQRLSKTSFKHSFWTIYQMLTHHASNGCQLRSGDLFGTGTQSGPTPLEVGSLLEMTEGGKRTVELNSGEERNFLEDYDKITLTGFCERIGFRRIGLGSVTGKIVPAKPT